VISVDRHVRQNMSQAARNMSAMRARASLRLAHGAHAAHLNVFAHAHCLSRARALRAATRGAPLHLPQPAVCAPPPRTRCLLERRACLRAAMHHACITSNSSDVAANGMAAYLARK